MQAYDVALKLLLKGPARQTIRALTGSAVESWLDVELPQVRNLRLDLLGRTTEGELVHVELQSSNHAAMPLRMLEYGLGVVRLLGQFPRQALLYVGEAPLQMENELRGPDLLFRYRLIDIRTLDGERLLASEDMGDNVIAILAKLRDHKEAVRKIVERIAGLPAAKQETALAELMILSGLRHLTETVEWEKRSMPIDLDIREHEVLGPMFKEAEQKGREEGRQEGELAILRRLIERRFGPLPKWAEERLVGLPSSALEDLGVRLFDATGLEDLLPR